MTSRLGGFGQPQRICSIRKVREISAYISELVIFLIAGGPIAFGFFAALSIGVYNWTSLTYILLSWLAEFLLLVCILSEGFIKMFARLFLTTEKVFYYAASYNLMVRGMISNQLRNLRQPAELFDGSLCL